MTVRSDSVGHSVARSAMGTNVPALYQHRRGVAAAMVTEQELLRDVLYAFQGIDGKYVRFCPEIDEYLFDPALLGTYLRFVASGGA